MKALVNQIVLDFVSFELHRNSISIEVNEEFLLPPKFLVQQCYCTHKFTNQKGFVIPKIIYAPHYPHFHASAVTKIFTEANLPRSRSHIVFGEFLHWRSQSKWLILRKFHGTGRYKKLANLPAASRPIAKPFYLGVYVYYHRFNRQNASEKHHILFGKKTFYSKSYQGY